MDLSDTISRAEDILIDFYSTKKT